MKFYLTGQNDFGNRGCEAIVRSTVAQLRDAFPGCTVLVPSRNEHLDRRQWPEAEDAGVRFVRRLWSPHNKYWRHVQDLPLPGVKSLGWPFPLDRRVKDDMSGADAVLSIGGDNYSLDYKLPSLLLAQDAHAMRNGVPVALWGASVGPFTALPEFERYVTAHLARMAFVGARESATHDYLTGNLGLKNVVRVADPAFGLTPEPVSLEAYWPGGERGVLGLNLSPLITRYRPKDEDRSVLLDEVAALVRDVTSSGYGVLLVPHVVPLTGAEKNNDAAYMRGILDRLGGDPRVRMADPELNAARIKYVLGECRFFIGARTHATIAALSSGVPTGSIAYSVKASGINQDLFGHTGYVLDTPKVSQDSLRALLAKLETDEQSIRERLAEAMPEWRARALANVGSLREALRLAA